MLALVLTGCSSYAGGARDFSPARLAERGWVVARGVPLEEQEAESDCGAAAIAMVVSFWTGERAGGLADSLRPASERGIPAGRLRDFARGRGLSAFLVRGRVADLEHELGRGRPVIVGLVKPQLRGVITHYEVVVAFHPARRIVVTLDPDHGWRQNRLADFLAEWRPAKELALVVSGPRRGAAHSGGPL